MRRLIGEIGPCSLRPKGHRSPFESLARAIAYQQLHDKAAESILKRFKALFPGRRFPRPDELLAMNRRSIRKAGFSRAKVLALRDLASKTLDGMVPTSRRIKQLDDETIVERLIEVRGVGRWTVEMLLIFQLGRPDVLPVDDFGVGMDFGSLMVVVPCRLQALCYDTEKGGSRIGLLPPGICGGRLIEKSRV